MAPPGSTFRTINSRSKAYRWTKTIAGISDRHQKICFSVALWNGQDPILKERLFVDRKRRQSREDCKECYSYLDSTPTHSYMKYLYKYPQSAFPYEQLVQENRDRGREKREFEWIDTGVFEDSRYFDVFTETEGVFGRYPDPRYRCKPRAGAG